MEPGTPATGWLVGRTSRPSTHSALRSRHRRDSGQAGGRRERHKSGLMHGCYKCDVFSPPVRHWLQECDSLEALRKAEKGFKLGDNVVPVKAAKVLTQRAAACPPKLVRKALATADEIWDQTSLSPFHLIFLPLSTWFSPRPLPIAHCPLPVLSKP